MDREPSLVKPYVKSYGLTFPNLLDPTGRVSPMFNARYTPTNFLVDRKGYVIGGSIGYRDWDTPESHQLIEALLEQETEPKN